MSVGRYKEYPKYRESEIEWVGDIPAGWVVKPLLAVADSRAVKNDDGKENNVLSLSYGSIIRRDVDDNFGLLPESFNTYQLVATGDIILRLTDLQNDKRSLRVGRANENGIITSAYLKLSAKSDFIESRYLYRLLHSYDTTKVFYGMGGGLRQSMKFDDMRRLDVLIPPLPEQTQIAAFLDHETAKIDRLIEKQQALISLLKEKRQAVISHAVTKGLNPQAPLKNSGIEWLGQVPAHWTVLEMKRFCSVRGGFAFSSDSFIETGKPVIRIGDIRQDGSIDLDGCKCVSDLLAIRYENFSVQTGEIVMAMTGATIGKAGWFKYEIPCLVNQRVGVFRHDSDSLDYRYLWYSLASSGYQEYIRLTAFGGAQPNISDTGMVGYFTSLPPIEEQRAIVDLLDEQTAKIDVLTEKAENTVTFLQERRTALISAAVTGKIDVRHWQPPSN